MPRKSKRLYFGLGGLLLLVTCLAVLFAAARLGYERGYAAGETQRRREHFVTRVYDVNDLLAESGDRAALAEFLHDNVDPSSWADTGGQGSLNWFEGPPPQLVISQSEAAHDQVSASLRQLRRYLNRNPRNDSRPGEPVSQPADEE